MIRKRQRGDSFLNRTFHAFAHGSENLAQQGIQFCKCRPALWPEKRDSEPQLAGFRQVTVESPRAIKVENDELLGNTF